VCNGTVAISLALVAAGLAPGDEVHPPRTPQSHFDHFDPFDQFDPLDRPPRG